MREFYKTFDSFMFIFKLILTFKYSLIEILLLNFEGFLT